MALTARDTHPPSSVMRGRPDTVPGGDEAEPDGFVGAISHLGLPDVIQLEGQNRFSGCILVNYQEQEGQIFFRLGEIVHAEVGSHSGDEAFNRILSWPGGTFRLHPNVTSLQRSIEKRLDHLLLAAHQWLDETRHGAPDPGPARPPAPKAAPPNLMQAITSLPGVVHAVFMDRSGSPRGEAVPHGEELAAKGTYLAAMVAAPLGEAFGLGDLQVAALQAKAERILLLRSKETGLSVRLAPEARLDEVEGRIRQLVSARRTGP